MVFKLCSHDPGVMNRVSGEPTVHPTLRHQSSTDYRPIFDLVQIISVYLQYQKVHGQRTLKKETQSSNIAFILEWLSDCRHNSFPILYKFSNLNNLNFDVKILTIARQESYQSPHNTNKIMKQQQYHFQTLRGNLCGKNPIFSSHPVRYHNQP